MNLLAVLDQDVEIVIRQEQRSRKREAGSPSSRPNCDGREPRGAHGTVHHVAESRKLVSRLPDLNPPSTTPHE